MMLTGPRLLIALFTSLLLAGCATEPQGFESPEAAISALREAAGADDTARLRAILGSEHEDVYLTDDKARDTLARRDFCRTCNEKLVLNRVADDKVELVVGNAEWPMPTPLVCRDGVWYFDCADGVEEIINRRIGANELDAIELCRAFLDAQYIYADQDWNGDGRREFAAKMEASEGKYDGLWWEPDPEQGVPACPLQGFADTEEEYVELREPGDPWRGYRARLLPRQGPAAPGGAKSFKDGDDLTVGFAMIAWPDEYDVTGIMTFIVSHHGTVYERDLGEETEALAGAIEVFDPTPEWAPVEE